MSQHLKNQAGIANKTSGLLEKKVIVAKMFSVQSTKGNYKSSKL